MGWALIIVSLMILFIAGVLRTRYDLSRWGGIWRSCIVWAISLSLGYGAALVVRYNVTDPDINTNATFGTGIAVWLLVATWLVRHFPGAAKAVAKRHASLHVELAAAEARHQPQPRPQPIIVEASHDRHRGKQPPNQPQPARLPNAGASSMSSTAISEQIRLLGALRDEGLLTEDEFQEKKSRILELV